MLPSKRALSEFDVYDDGRQAIRRRLNPSIMNISLDLVHEILRYLLPTDLLQISRANKDIRATLLNKESVTVWIAARENAGAPPPFPGMSEPTWASLVFESACRICFKNKTRDVYWALRVRICFSCASTSFLRRDPELVNESYPGFDQPAMAAVAAVVCSPTERIVQSEYFFKTEFEAIMRAYNALNSDAAKAQFMVQRKALKEAIAQHASRVKAWAKIEEENRKQDEEKIRQDRKHAIIERLVRSGYPEARDDAQVLHDLEARYPEHFQPPVPLTDGAWSRMMVSLLETMAQLRERRLINKRKEIAIEVLRQWKRFEVNWLNGGGMSAVLPSPYDWCNFPPVKAIIQQPAFESDDAIRRAFAKLDTVRALQEAVDWWRENIILWFNDSVIGQLKSFPALHSPHDRAKALTVASTRPFSFVYKCITCNPDWDPFHTQTEPSVLTNPEVLQHRCLTRTMFSYGDIDSTDPSVVLDPAKNLGLCRTAWSPHSITVDYKAQPVFEHLFRLISFGNIPDSRTLDNSPFVFACSHCKTSDTDKLYGWRAATEHALKYNLLPVLQDSWTAYNVNHLQLPLPVPVKSKIWLCSICRDLPEELVVPQYPADIQAHLIQAHSIVHPAAKDYYRVCSTVSYTSLTDGVTVNI